MVHYLILKFLVIDTQRILACINLQYADQSLMLAFAQPEIYLYNQQQVNRILPQSERCKLLAWSMHIMVLLDLKISWVLACTWSVSILRITNNLKQVFFLTDHLVQANIQFP